MKYWIKDRVDSPQQFPLKLLFLAIVKTVGTEPLQLHVSRSQGYGRQIAEWDESLDNNAILSVEKDVLEKLLEGTEEWFYDLSVEVKSNNQTVRFGLHDSTAMFIYAPQEIASRAVEMFENVEIANSVLD